MDPRFRSEDILAPLEIEEAMILAKELDPKLVGIIMKFRIGKEPFMPTMFTDGQQIEGTHATSCMTTTAELERLYSTFGFLHSSLRNRLGIEKCGKLAFCF